MDNTKYGIGYYLPPKMTYDWVKKDHITTPPHWCSVDLRDGNQSLIIPMSLEEKLDFYKTLLAIGFKEIEVGFPASSQTEYDFLRTIIENKMIPNDVSIQVLTQCREHIIRRTFEACKGATSAIIHFYNSTSVAQREQVFKKSKEEIKKIAVEGAKLVKKLANEYEGNFRFEYSPESFTGTEPEYALEVCNAVLDVLQPSETNNVIINLPVTVEMSSPHIYATQVEYMSKNLKYREFVTISLHPHNDRGTAVACAELGLLAGGDRVEGTLFGNGERTGNVDVVTLAMNMFSQGVAPNLDFSNLPKIIEMYEKCTRMKVYERSPYSGSLVFVAFSGSHQDAIVKGINWREEKALKQWSVPYIPIDPTDISRKYETDVIRVNSQSGKGGIGYILESMYGYNLPPKMRENFSYQCKDFSDKMHKELQVADVLNEFMQNYVDVQGNIFLIDYASENSCIKVNLANKNEKMTVRLDKNYDYENFKEIFKEASTATIVEMASEKKGEKFVSYLGIEWSNGKTTWGAGIDANEPIAKLKAFISAYNTHFKNN